MDSRQYKDDIRRKDYARLQESIRLELEDPDSYKYPPIPTLSSADDSSWSLPSAEQTHYQHTTGSYVLSLQILQNYYAASFSTPSNSIVLVDKSTLKRVGSWKAHEDGRRSGITALRTFPGGLLASSGKDGTVNTWDPRTDSKKPAISLSHPSRTGILSFDISPDDAGGILVVAGSESNGQESSILIWDIRSPESTSSSTSTKIWSHTSTHSNDITNIQFRPTAFGGRKILSTSVDGLLCISDPMQTDEEESMENVGNWGNSIAYCGWTAPSSASSSFSVWAVSDMETVSIWDDQLDLIRDYGPIKRALHEDWLSSYFVDGIYFSQDIARPFGMSPGLALVVGSDIGTHGPSGDLAFLSIENSNEWKLRGILQTGKRAVVRSVLWDPSDQIMLAGCEDSRICAWSFSNQHDYSSAAPVDGMAGSSDLGEMGGAGDRKRKRREEKRKIHIVGDDQSYPVVYRASKKARRAI